MALAAIIGYKPKEIINIEENLLKNEFFDKGLLKDIKAMIMNEIETYRKEEKENEGIKLSQEEKGFKYFTSGEKNVYSHMGFYVHGFRLTLYYVYHFDEVEEDKINNYSKYRVIMNQICTYGGDTDTNAAIVGAVIGPLIGYKNFGNDDFKKMVELVPIDRFIYSPALMILYVNFLKKSNNDGKIKDKMNFLRMILDISKNEINIKDLEKINSENKDNDNNTNEEIEREEKKEEKKEEKTEDKAEELKGEKK